ncbi:MAG TPA: sigma-70 family RNA polymerase sigma factor, partial [Ktedonobacterales bacterium]|nr:sigma-70 family RNA polymerase sigma factor [Ktedonobacterales bacterium]
MDSEDVACLRRIAQGDQSALADLYARYRLPLTRALWNQLGGDSAVIEDVLQETFLSIWRAANTFRGDAQVSTWIFRIAQHSAGEVQRRMSRDLRNVPLSELHEREGTAPAANHEQQSITRLTVHDALSRLTDKQREVIVLIFVHGFTGEEVARMLGVPLG